MTDQEILKKVILKSCEGGFKPEKYMTELLNYPDNFN